MTRPSKARQGSSLWWCATCRLQVIVPGTPTRALQALSPLDDVAPAPWPTTAALRRPLGSSGASGGRPLECPRIYSTDVDDLRLLVEWHEVKPETESKSRSY